MTQQLSVLEKTDDFLRSTGPNDKWYRYLEALLQKYAKLWRLREEEKAKLDHYTRKCRDVEEELSKKQAHIVRLKAALENETQEHHLAKLQLKKLGGQLQSAKDYMMGLDTQDEKTTDLINTICASPHPFRMASAVTLGNKSGSLLDDFEDNSISTEGSVSTGGTEDVFMSFRKPDDRQKPTTSEADMNSTSSSAQSSGSDLPPLRRSLRKRNSSEESDMVISKKLKAGDKASLVVSVDEDNKTVSAEARIKSASASTRRRSKSVDARLDGVACSTPLAPSRDTMRTPMKEDSSPLYRSSSASKLMNRQHTFLTKTVMVFENCGRCKRRLKFYKEALRCDDCHLTVHLDCRDDAPLPCIPKSNRMTGNKSQRLVDFCPVVGPRVPPILINCFHEIEKAHRIKEVGIYRLSGARSQVQALSRKLQKHVNHDLSSYETATITGVVKQFLLESLSEPLIPSSVWTHFEKITEPGNPDVEHKIRGEVASLPVHNRDTLAFVMLHLKVVEQVPENKMNRQNLATVFAPSVVGYSLTAQMKPELLLAANQLVSERIMACLLDVEPTFWDNIMKTADKKRTTLRDRTHKNGGTISFASPKLT